MSSSSKGTDPQVLSYRPCLISTEALYFITLCFLIPDPRSKQSADGVIRTPNVIKYLARLVWVGPPEAVISEQASGPPDGIRISLGTPSS